ncbi:hypothetical protein WJX81_001400 [Elliptochloris bilobata]|uniref:Uncharacterized protein n=1 Tax=Elliptochloris bilobata TaxID=381761 RepID=A0AAW1S091_9CHLO
MRSPPRRCSLLAQAENEQRTTTKAEEDDLPIWARDEVERQEKEDGLDLPFGVYLLASAIVAIAAVGSIFEFANKNAIFGTVPPSSPFYAPIQLTFALTGIPSAGFLFLKAIKSANREAERQDRADGF